MTTKKQSPKETPPKPQPLKLCPVKIRQRADVATGKLLEALDEFIEPYDVMIGGWAGGATPAIDLLAISGRMETVLNCVKALSKKFDSFKNDAPLGLLAISWQIGGGGKPAGKLVATSPEAATKLAAAIAD